MLKKKKISGSNLSSIFYKPSKPEMNNNNGLSLDISFEGRQKHKAYTSSVTFDNNNLSKNVNQSRNISSMQKQNLNFDSTKYNSISSSNFNSLSNIYSKKTKSLKKSSLSPEEKNKLNIIIKNFKNNKVATKELYDLEKENRLNGITNTIFKFLLPDNQKKLNKINLVSSKMIRLFNNKVSKYLEPGRNKEKYSKNINEFRKQIINSYKDNDKEINQKSLFSRKQDYFCAVNAIDDNFEKQVKKAEKTVKQFYKSKNYFEKKSTSKNILKSLKLKCSDVVKYKSYEDEKSDNPLKAKETIKRGLSYKYFNKFTLPNNILYKESKTEALLSDCKRQYTKYFKKKIKLQAKLYADSFYNINHLQYQPLTQDNNDYSFINLNNLRRVMKVNSINKNLYCIDEDELLVRNLKKLKEEIKNAEFNYYTLSIRNPFHLNFLKTKVKSKTIQKLNNMKNSCFGIP